MTGTNGVHHFAYERCQETHPFYDGAVEIKDITSCNMKRVMQLKVFRFISIIKYIRIFQLDIFQIFKFPIFKYSYAITINANDKFVWLYLVKNKV